MWRPCWSLVYVWSEAHSSRAVMGTSHYVSRSLKFWSLVLNFPLFLFLHIKLQFIKKIVLHSSPHYDDGRTFAAPRWEKCGWQWGLCSNAELRHTVLFLNNCKLAMIHNCKLRLLSVAFTFLCAWVRRAFTIYLTP